MPSVEHYLEELEHIYNKYNLKLRTHGCVTLSSPRSSDYALPSNVQDLDASISSGTYIAGSNRLRLLVEIIFDDIAVTDSSISQTIEDIGVVFCSAELWSQLCLNASLTINDSNKFLISLSAHPSSNADIHPPSHIPSMCLEDIGMTFYFSSCRRTRLASKPRVTLSASAVHYIEAPPTDPFYEHLDRPYFAPFSLPGGLQSVYDTQSDQSARRIPVLSSRRHRYAIQEVKFEALVQLVDSSLRRMMSDCKPVKQAGIVLSSDAGFLKLATISPTLFSPGYAKAISQHSRLLPTIARAVSGVHGRTKSSRLRHKLDRLQELPLGSHLDHGSTKDSSSISASVEARLWFLTQNKLFDPSACRGLKSLNTSNETGLGSQEMLEESLDDSGDVMLDGNETRTLDSYDDAGDVMLDGNATRIFGSHDDAMELDEANHVNNFHEHSLDVFSHDGEGPGDNQMLRNHSQDEVSYSGGETLDDDTAPFVND